MKTLIVVSSCMLFCCSAVMANLSGSDNFDDNVMDPAKWSVLFGDGLNETNSRLEYSGGSGEAEGMLAWIANKGSYVNNWSVSIDTFISVDETSLSDQFVNYGLGVVPPPLNSIFSLELRVGEDGGESNPYRHIVTAYDDGNAEVFQHQLPLSLDSVRLQVSFDASAKVLTSYYDAGGSMTALTDYNVSAWGMGDGDEFTIVVLGWSQDVSPVSGEVYGDNFVAIPEPGTLGLLAVAVCGLLLARCKR